MMLDFYGTVVHEDGPVIAGICERVAASVGHAVAADRVGRLWATAFASECGACFGARFKTQRAAARDSLARVLEEVRSSEDPELLCSSQFDFWQRPPLYDDAKEFLARVELPICIVSNIDRADLEQAMEHHAIAADHVITSEDVRSYKPRPELFARALELLGVAPGAALHVGDSLSSDVAGANQLGIPVAWVNRSGRRPHNTAVLWAIVTDLVTLTELLRGPQ
jgi:2-haloacid dehalogenase/putative hydrolase of the HAD superfamily